MAIFTVKSKELTDAEILRIHGLQTPNVTVQIESVDFRRTDEVKPSEPKTVKPVETSVVQEPILISSDSTFDPFPPTLRSRIRDRFQGRIGTNRVEDFLISRHQRRF